MRFLHILQPNQIQISAMLNASHRELDGFIAIFLRIVRTKLDLLSTALSIHASIGGGEVSLLV